MSFTTFLPRYLARIRNLIDQFPYGIQARDRSLWVIQCRDQSPSQSVQRPNPLGLPAMPEIASCDTRDGFMPCLRWHPAIPEMASSHARDDIQRYPRWHPAMPEMASSDSRDCILSVVNSRAGILRYPIWHPAMPEMTSSDTRDGILRSPRYYGAMLEMASCYT